MLFIADAAPRDLQRSSDTPASQSAVAHRVSHEKYASTGPLIRRRIRSALQDGHKPIHYFQELYNVVVSRE
jgi:hypothetical protein